MSWLVFEMMVQRNFKQQFDLQKKKKLVAG